MSGGVTTKRSKNISKSEYVFAEKHFLWLSAKKQVLYWLPLKYESLYTIRKQLNRQDFPSEKWFTKELNRRGVKGYLRNWPIANRFFADFYFPRAGVAIEIDGKEHRYEQDKRRDRIFHMFHVRTIRINHSDEYKMEQIIDWLSSNELCKGWFRLQRKKVSDADLYKFFPPEVKPIPKDEPKVFVPKTIIRRLGKEEKIL